MVQLIAVTAAAVVLSNLAVAYWFETSNEQQNEASLNERVLDRAATVAHHPARHSARTRGRW